MKTIGDALYITWLSLLGYDKAEIYRKVTGDGRGSNELYGR